MWATSVQASELSVVASTSLASLRHRPNHANVRFTTQHLEALCGVGALDDLHCPASQRGQGLLQLVAGIAAIRKDVPQPRVEPANGGQHGGCTVPILDAGAVHDQADQVACGVGDDVALAPLDLLAGVEPPGTAAFRGVLAD